MPEDDTSTFRKAQDVAGKHSGKIATVSGGGFSLLLAYQLFVPTSQFQMLREDLRELNRDFREHEVQCAARHASRTNDLTVVASGVKVRP